MKVIIQGMPEGLAGRGNAFEPAGISADPEGRYAVLELFPSELFVAAEILRREDGEMRCRYVNHFFWQDDVPMLLKFSVDWSCLRYGFCKLDLWAPEAPGPDGSFSRTVKRFYFNWELYKACYEEIHGVPCEREDPNRRD